MKRRKYVLIPAMTPREYSNAKVPKRILLTLFFSLAVVVPGWASSPEAQVKAGNVLYREGKFDASAEKYEEALKKDAQSDIVNFNLGAALYKKGEFDKAIEHFNQSLLSQRKGLENQAHYNLGNAFYKLGIDKEKTDLKNAVGQLEQALPHYESVLAQGTKDADAKHNYDFVSKELERLKKELEKQQQNQQQTQGQNKEQKKSELKEEQSKSEQAKPEEAQGQESKEKQARQQQAQEEKKKEGREKKEDGQEAKDEGRGTKDEGGETKGEDTAGQGQKENAAMSGDTEGQENSKELSAREAKMLLEKYQQNEEPRGLLPLHPREAAPESQVDKDW